jgi:hypothetical protein
MIFLTKMKTKAKVVPNLDHKTRRITRQLQINNQQNFICKKEKNKVMTRKCTQN